MFLLIILVSYILGCVSTIALLLYLYTRYAFSSPVTFNEQEEEQYQTFHPLPENEQAKNSAVDGVNYLFQFLFQELKDSSGLRRYIMHKLNIEFNELKNSRTGKIFLQNIAIQSFSIGKECPVLSDIQLERQERDERNLIKKFVANIDADYKDGFSVTLDVTLLFGHKCQLFIKVKRIQGRLRLEFRREPFCHWLLVFQDEPFIDFHVKSYFAAGESPQVAQIITQQLRRAMKRKQTWPSYKIRYTPFFATSEQSLPIEILSANGNNLIPGTFNVLIKHCDRLSIPLRIFDKQKISFVSVFLTVNINEQMCADYLHIERQQWPMKEIELTRNIHKIIAKQVIYMDRTELLIENIDPIPNGIENVAAFKAALEDKNMFLLQIQGHDVKTLKQMNRLLKFKPIVSPNDGTTTSTPPPPTTNAYEDKIKIIVGMPLLHSVRVQYAVERSNIIETEKQGGYSPTLSIRNDISSTSASVRKRFAEPAIKFDKNIDSIGLENKPLDDDDDDEQIQNTNMEDTSIKSSSTNTTKKPKQPKSIVNEITLIMMNADILQKFQAQPTPTQKAEPHIEFNHKFNFQVDPNERFLNVCLWCKPPLDCDVPNAGKKLILLGYATVALSEVVLDAHMSYKRETQTTLNFRSPYSESSSLSASLTDSESKKLLELATHKGYDDNLAHGFVTINIEHQPEIEAGLNPQEKKDQFAANTPTLTALSKRIKENEKKQSQLKYINAINAQHELPTRKLTDHLFEDKAFTVATVCGYCKKKIWMKIGRQCRDCLITIHKKCEDKFNAETTCTHEPTHLKTNLISTTPDDDNKGLVHIELNDASIAVTDDTDPSLIKNNYELVQNPIHNRTTTALPTTVPPTTTLPTTAYRLSTKAVAAFSVLDSTARRSFRAFGNRNANPTTTTTSLVPDLTETSELSKSDESLNTPSTTAPTRPTILHHSIQTSSKLANAASSAYSKFREFKSKRLPLTSETNPIKQTRATLNLKSNENIPESDLRDIITKCLSDESNDITSLEHLLHERAVDDTELYAKAREFGQELFPDLTPDERKQRLDNEISRLQQEIDLQCQVRDEMTHECENSLTDENEKRKLRTRIANIDEKVQALGALTILYCSGLKHCCTQMATQENMNNTNNELINELLDEDETNDLDDSQYNNSEE
ncbi:unnamed protein product [Rotaria sordida]|uniref:Phorbol-ester/DAG-type domain-containing protein n=1 Tax=Rotaria sordida TaxID=392033 RepID=A0A818K024_9BILA|nr:unnamed protein product [Rotaria sordida]